MENFKRETNSTKLIMIAIISVLLIVLYLTKDLLKSDDIDGRTETFSAIVEGRKIPKPSIPESFRVLLRELQALAIDITTYRFEKNLKKLELNVKEIKL